MNIGFTSYTQPTPVVELTLKEKIALLSAQQKSDLLNAFINKIPPAHLDHRLGIPKDVIEEIYTLIDDIQVKSKEYMRGEVIITPAVVDIDGNITTPAIMNTPPATQNALTTIITPLFTDFTSGQVTAIINAMIKWCKFDGTGTFAFYQSQVIL